MKKINLPPDYSGIEISEAGQIYLDGTRTRFNIKELVSKKVYSSQGIFALGLIRPTLIRAIHFLRVYFETTIYVNTWAYQNGPGNFEQRCHREIDAIGARYSRHKYGMAVDFNVRNMASDRVYDHILDNQSDFLFAGFTTIEDKRDATTWTHLDIRDTNLIDQMLIVGV